MEFLDDPQVDAFTLEDVPDVSTKQHTKRVKEKRRWRAELDKGLSEGAYASTTVGKNAAFDGMMVGSQDDTKRRRRPALVLHDESDDDDEDNVDDDDGGGGGSDDEDDDEEGEYTHADAEAAMDDIFAELDEDNAELEGGAQDESYEEWVAKQEGRAEERKKQRQQKKTTMSADEEVAENLLRGDEHMARELQKLKNDAVTQQRKGQHAKNQVRIHADLVNLRIRLQKPLTICNRLPQVGMMALFCQYAKAKESKLAQLPKLLDEAKELTHSLLTELFDLHDALTADSPEFFHTKRAVERAECAKKRKREGAEEAPAINELWADVEAYYNATKPFVNDALEVWGQKARSYDASANKKFRALDQSPLEQIKQTLRDKATLTQKTQVNRLKVRRLGCLNNVPITEDTMDPEIYDDNDFYGTLLGEVISQGLSQGNAAELVKQMEEKRELQKKQNLARLAIDHKASKARKPQFDVHERLVNYMAPKPVFLPPHADSLFQSLFWTTQATG